MSEHDSRFSITVDGDWLGGTRNADDATFGPVAIRAFDTVLTEVVDALAKSTRPHIRVPATHLATFLLANYWRLAWEPRPRSPSLDWKLAHSLSAIGGGHAWPALEISGDGELVELNLAPEEAADVAAIRYLNRGTFVIERAEFDRALDRFGRSVIDRLAATLPSDSTLGELAAELQNERGDADLSRLRALEARAGFGSSEATEGWAHRIEVISRDAGSQTALEFACVAPVERIEEVLSQMQHASTTLNLSPARSIPYPPTRIPWERGALMAKTARQRLGLGEGPIQNETLSQLLAVSLPLQPDTTDPTLLGAYQSGGLHRAVVKGRHITSQRFYLARLLGTAAETGHETVVPVTNAATSVQKAARSFAQEFLLPWDELDALTNESGTDPDVVADIADRYRVSEALVTTTLVNRRKIERERLPLYG